MTLRLQPLGDVIRPPVVCVGSGASAVGYGIAEEDNRAGVWLGCRKDAAEQQA